MNGLGQQDISNRAMTIRRMGGGGGGLRWVSPDAISTSGANMSWGGARLGRGKQTVKANG